VFWNALEACIENKIAITLEDLLLSLEDASGRFTYTI